MDTAVILDREHFEAAAAGARAAGQTMAEYLHALIDGEAQTFEQILGPVRDGSTVKSEEEVDKMFEEARSARRRGA